jgi:hypothetical protein
MRMACGPGTWVTEVNQGRRPLSAAEKDHLVPAHDTQPAYAGRDGADPPPGGEPPRPRRGSSSAPTTRRPCSSTAGSGTTYSSRREHPRASSSFPAGRGPPAGTR